MKPEVVIVHNVDYLSYSEDSINAGIQEKEFFAKQSSDIARERREAELLPTQPILPMKHERRNKILQKILQLQLCTLEEILRRVSPSGDFIELTPKAGELYNNRRKAISDAIKTANQFCAEARNFITNNTLKKPIFHDDETLYLACICSRVHAALKFLSNENNAHLCNNHCFVVGEKYEAVEDVNILIFYPCKEGWQKVTYDIVYHQENLREIQKLCAHLSGYRWESVRNAAYALSAALFCVSIAIGLTVGTGGIAFPAIVAAGALSAGFGFYASKDSGIAKAVSELELNAIEFPTSKKL